MKRLIIVLCLWGLMGCALVHQQISQSGYLRVGIYPRHNEAVDGQTQLITKWKMEAAEAIRYGRLEIAANPILRLDNAWPDGSYTYSWNTAVLEGNLETRFYLAEPVYLYYRKTKHWLLGHQQLGGLTDRQVCQCTYWNEVGVEVRW